MNRTLFALVALASWGALAVEAEWETVSDKDGILVKNRPRPGASVTEVWAETVLNAPVKQLQEALLEINRFKDFMPHMAESRYLGPPLEDGSRHAYTRLNFPILNDRDYVVRVWVDEGTKPDGSGEFRQRWKAVPDRLPEREGCVRLRINDGSWHIRPIGDGSKSAVTYKFATDPGGIIPAFAAAAGNRDAVPDTLRALEKEARLRLARKVTEAGK